MTVTLGTVITAARDRSPWFYETRVTDATVARFLSDAQNDLIGAAVRRDPQFVAQSASIVVRLSGADAPGVVGAGTSGGVPGSIDQNGFFGTVETGIGSLVEVGVTSAEGAAVLVSERTVTSATATTLTRTGIGRTVNGDTRHTLVITGGTGDGQRRLVQSNTVDTWTISTGSDGMGWTTVPDTTSLFMLVSPALRSDNAIGVVTQLPALSTSTGYLVRVDATGSPFIDYTAPLIATVDAGAPLPAMHFPLDGTVRYTDGSSGPLRICAVEQRFGSALAPSVYVMAQSVYLAGGAACWNGVQSISLRYTPVAPPFTAIEDVFLLPDHARAVLVAKAAEFMAVRVSGLPGVTIDPTPHANAARESEAQFMSAVSAAKRVRGLGTRAVW